MAQSLTWHDVLGAEKAEPYFQQILQQVASERVQGKIVYPPQKDVFNAFKRTAFDDVKVVILGQDPYHGAGQAHGLSFSVAKGIAVPPSLRNIYKELADEDPQFVIPNHGNLESWADQGVLLLNTVLTVEQGKAHSHAKFGWQRFTDKVIQTLNEQKDHVVFLLWGKPAQAKAAMIDHNKHCVLTAPHPSPFSAHSGFFGCGHFQKANSDLAAHGLTPINWHLPL